MLKPKPVKSLDIREILSILKKRKWLIIIPLILVTGIAYGSTYFMAPRYESSTIVWIDRPSNVSTELQRILGGTNRRVSREEQRNRTLAIETELTSQGYLFQVIQNLHIDDDPEISREAAKLRETNTSISLEQIKFNLLVEKLRKQISVTFYGSDQIKIKVEAGSPTRARDIAEQLTTILETEKTKYEMQKVLDNQRFNDVQLQKTEQYYQLAIDSLNNARIRLSKLQLPENISSESNRVDILSTIDNIEMEINDYKKEEKSLAKQLKEFNLDKLKFKFSDTMVELRTTIDGLITNYVNMMEKYSWNDQNIINVNIRLNDNSRLLENIIKTNIEKEFSTYPENQKTILARSFNVREHLDILNSKKRRLKQSLANIDETVNKIPKLESEIQELVNRVNDYRRYRDAFKTEETTVGLLSERAKERTTYKIIEPAKLPLVPVWPNKRNIVLIGIVLGLALGGAFVFLFELLDNSFKRIEDIEEELGVQVVATIPKIENYQLHR